MNMTERQVVSITEASQNFSAVAREYDYSMPFELTDSEKIDVAARRILKRYHKAFEELAR